MGRSRILETNGANKLVKSRVPYTRSLLSSVYCLRQLQTVEVVFHAAAVRNRAEHIFLHFTVEESCHHVKLVHSLAKYVVTAITICSQYPVYHPRILGQDHIGHL